MRLRSLLIIITMNILLVPNINAATITVALDGSGTQNTIQNAIDISSDGDTIVVYDGTYTGTGNVNIDFKGKLVNLKSQNGKENCIIDCQNNSRAFYLRSKESYTINPDGSLNEQSCIIDGFTIINANTEYGGAIRCGEHRPKDDNGNYIYDEYTQPGATENTASPVIRNCTIKNSYTPYWGAAIACNSSSPWIINCVISDNHTESDQYGYGAGISARNDSNPIIENCTISNNSGYWGAGIYFYKSASAEVKNCVIKNNSSRFDGGGISNWNSSPTIEKCVIWGNSSYNGAGISCKHNSSVEINNSIIVMNYASGFGGGVYAIDNGNATITNCTIADNKAYGGDNYWVPAGGIYLDENSSGIVKDSIIWGNSEIETGLYPIVEASLKTLVSIQDSCLFNDYSGTSHPDYENLFTLDDDDGDANVTIYSDPLFIGVGDYGLSDGSPCISGGSIIIGAPSDVIIKAREENIQPKSESGDDKKYYECFISTLF